MPKLESRGGVRIWTFSGGAAAKSY